MAKTVLNLTNILAVVKCTDTETIGLKSDLLLSNEVVNQVLTTSSLSGGTGYTAHTNVATTGGTGTGLTVNTVVVGGIIQSITLYNAGSGYTANDTITITGGGGNATFTVATVSIEPIVNIKGFICTGASGSTISVVRNSVTILNTAPEHIGYVDFEQFVDNIQNTKDIVVNITGNAQIYLTLRKQDGYYSQNETTIFGVYDDPTRTGA